jgi:hypothetical protein
MTQEAIAIPRFRISECTTATGKATIQHWTTPLGIAFKTAVKP